MTPSFPYKKKKKKTNIYVNIAIINYYIVSLCVVRYFNYQVRVYRQFNIFLFENTCAVYNQINALELSYYLLECLVDAIAFGDVGYQQNDILVFEIIL